MPVPNLRPNLPETLEPTYTILYAKYHRISEVADLQESDTVNDGPTQYIEYTLRCPGRHSGSSLFLTRHNRDTAFGP